MLFLHYLPKTKTPRAMDRRYLWSRYLSHLHNRVHLLQLRRILQIRLHQPKTLRGIPNPSPILPPLRQAIPLTMPLLQKAEAYQVQLFNVLEFKTVLYPVHPRPRCPALLLWTLDEVAECVGGVLLCPVWGNGTGEGL